jgi:uncharacterized protein YciI
LSSHFLLFYDFVDDYLDRRGEFRDEHLTLAWEANARGELILGGALAEPADAGVIWFQGDSPEVAERFAEADPYVRNGLVKRWRVRPWTTVVGDGAASPVRPAS